jgi:hypothetical protein
MSTFKEIRGQLIKSVSSDPANAGGGDMWYNSTSQTLKGVVAVGAWSSAAPLTTARGHAGGSGTQTAGLLAGGDTFPDAKTGATEEYNGSGWSLGGTMNTPRAYVAAAGTQTASLGFSGYTYPPPNPAGSTATEEYNGSSWTSVNNMNQARFGATGCGTQTSGLGWAGRSPAPTEINNTEEYDGTNWTTGGVLTQAKVNTGGAGASQTAGLAFGGEGGPGNLNQTEEYDGSSWTTGGNLGTARRNLAGSGIQTAALAFGGLTSPPDTVKASTEQYDGTSWSTTGSLATARQNLSGSLGGTISASWAAGGRPTSSTAMSNTEEYNFSANTITPGAWASGGALGTARYVMGSAVGAPSTAALVYGGSLTGTGNTANTEAYNGTSWSEQNNLNTARTRIAGFGTQTAAVAVAGRIMGGTDSVTNVEEYNGSWTNVTAYPFAVRGAQGSGTLTAGLVSGGQIPPYSTTCKEYDGTNWTTAGSLNTARGYAAGIFGTQTATGFAGGESPAKSNYEEYNGSSWSEVSTLGTATSNGFGFGTIESATIGNSSPSGSVGSQQWNGLSWYTAPSMSVLRSFYGGGGASSSSGLGAGGYVGGLKTETEEFTGETTAANVKTFTTS